MDLDAFRWLLTDEGQQLLADAFHVLALGLVGIAPAVHLCHLGNGGEAHLHFLGFLGQRYTLFLAGDLVLVGPPHEVRKNRK